MNVPKIIDQLFSSLNVIGLEVDIRVIVNYWISEYDKYRPVVPTLYQALNILFRLNKDGI